MLATRALTPADLPTGPGWAFEVKWDGMRVLADTTSGALRLWTRSARDVSVAFPELAALAKVQGAVLDGEVVAMAAGVPSFAALAERMHVRDAARAGRLAQLAPVTYLVFDVLQLYGVDVTQRAFDERRAALERLTLPPHVQLSPVYPDGAELTSITLRHGLEGVLAKRQASTYQPGRRSPDWVKLAHRLTRTAVVGGWRAENGSPTRAGALLLGAPDQAGRLRYLGKAGSGLAGGLGLVIADRLRTLGRESSPFDAHVTDPALDDVHWCEPVTLVDISYLARTRAGRLRQPVVRGPRDDTAADPWEDW